MSNAKAMDPKDDEELCEDDEEDEKDGLLCVLTNNLKSLLFPRSKRKCDETYDSIDEMPFVEAQSQEKKLKKRKKGLCVLTENLKTLLSKKKRR
jgi:flagellar motility protein MotE (MotC chaperone)